MTKNPDTSWFDNHPTFALAVILLGVALLLWLVFRKRGALPSLPQAVQAPTPQIIVSQWNPLQ
jgi:hypothetical protein